MGDLMETLSYLKQQRREIADVLLNREHRDDYLRTLRELADTQTAIAAIEAILAEDPERPAVSPWDDPAYSMRK